MEAIRKVANVKDNMLVIPGLDVMNNRMVEVIILPYDEAVKSAQAPTRSLKGSVRKYDDPFGPAASPDEWDAAK